jgi:hypothetical protein
MPSAKVYMTSGGDDMKVSSSGYVTVESGGQIDVESGGHIDLESGGYIAAASGGYVTVASGGYMTLSGYITVASGGYINVASGGYIREPVQVIASTGTQLNNYGVSTIPTATAYKKYTMARPAVGVRKTIQFSIASSSAVPANIDLSSGVTIVGDTTETAARYIGGRNSTVKTEYIDMVALTTAKWLCLSKSTSVLLTTALTTA